MAVGILICRLLHSHGEDAFLQSVCADGVKGEKGLSWMGEVNMELTSVSYFKDMFEFGSQKDITL